MLIDSFDREVDYLRVSVTERCNFRCNYCMPEKPFSWVPKENLLKFEELFLFIKVAIDEGVKKIRITGGEPTLREGLDRFIKMIYDYAPDIDLAMTSNGYLLKDQAKRLKDAGLKRINISLDSLDLATAGKIANKNVLNNVLAGIEQSIAVGLKVKINMVPMRGVNDHEILDILEFCKERNIIVRFIEYMENSYAVSELYGVSSKEILDKISKKYIVKDNGFDGHSPSHYYTTNDGYKFGIIEPHQDDFCKQCNRIRLTAEGYLIPCLYFDEALSIAKAVQNKDIKGAAEVLRSVVKNKPEKNRWGGEEQETSNRAFYETGG